MGCVATSQSSRPICTITLKSSISITKCSTRANIVQDLISLETHTMFTCQCTTNNNYLPIDHDENVIEERIKPKLWCWQVQWMATTARATL